VSDATELKVAEMLHADAKYIEIERKLHVGSDTIKNVKNLVAQGIIAFDAEGKAFVARPAEKNIEEIHAQVMEVVTKKATEQALLNAEEDYALGNEIRQYWTIKAQEMGMSLKELVKAALIFYDEYREQIDDMAKKIGAARWAFTQLRMDTARVAKMELFYKFMRYCLYLKSQGFTVPTRLIYDFYEDLTVLEKGGTTLKTEGKLEAMENV